MRLQDPNLLTAVAHIANLCTSVHTKDKLPYAMYNIDGCTIKYGVVVDPDGYVKIEPHGQLIIRNTGDRDPDWRYRARQRFGVGCDLASEFSGKLICPHTGKKIPVSRIEGNPVVLADYEHKVALLSGNVIYDTPESAPRKDLVPRGSHNNTNTIKYSLNNPKRYKEVKERMQKLRAEAKVRLDLAGGYDDYSNLLAPSTEEVIKKVIADTSITDIASLCGPIEGTKDEADVLLMVMATCVAVFRWCDGDHFKLLCADRYESEFLRYEP